MALKIAFKIRKKLPPKSEEEVVICFRITESSRVDITLATPFTIPYKFWDAKTGGIKDGATTNDRAVYERLKVLNTRLNGLKGYLYDELFRTDSITKEAGQPHLNK